MIVIFILISYYLELLRIWKIKKFATEEKQGEEKNFYSDTIRPIFQRTEDIMEVNESNYFFFISITKTKIF